MRKYFLNMLFMLKVGVFLLLASFFSFLAAFFPFYKTPERFNLHSVVNRIAFWYRDICIRVNQRK